MKKQGKKVELDERIEVGILIPSGGMWEVEFGKSLVSLFQHTSSWRPDPSLGIKSLRLRLYCLGGSMLVTNRQKLIAHAMKDGCTHMLFIDDDMYFPADALVKMLLRGKKFIAGNYVSRTFPCEWIGHDLEGKRLDSSKKRGIQKAQHAGCGFMLIHRSIVEKLSVPLFMMEWIPDVHSHCGEDVYFCAKVQAEAGEDLWIDHDVSNYISHVGKLRYHGGLAGMELPPPLWQSKEDAA